jgi:hypothetical protein
VDFAWSSIVAAATHFRKLKESGEDSTRNRPAAKAAVMPRHYGTAEAVPYKS